MLTRAKHKLITADLGSDRLQLAGSSHTPIIGPRHTAAHLRDSSPSGLPLAVLPTTLLSWLYWSLLCPPSQSCCASPRQVPVWSPTGSSPLHFIIIYGCHNICVNDEESRHCVAVTALSGPRSHPATSSNKQIKLTMVI